MNREELIKKHKLNNERQLDKRKQEWVKWMDEEKEQRKQEWVKWMDEEKEQRKQDKMNEALKIARAVDKAIEVAIIARDVSFRAYRTAYDNYLICHRDSAVKIIRKKKLRRTFSGSARK